MSVIVIGAGANELVCAHLLARAGSRVIVLDERAAHDGAEEEPGWIPPRVVRDLALAGRGLVVRHPDPWVVAPLPGGGRLELWQDMARSVDSIRRVSPADAAKWPAFCERMARLARLLERLYDAPPPDPVGSGAGDLAQLAGLGWRLRRLGRQGMEDLLRLVPMAVADWLDDWFESDALKGVLAASGVRHYVRGPRAGGTAFRLLHHHVGCPAGVFRPPQSNLARVLAALTGIEIRRGARMARISVHQGRVAGVVLAGGEEIAAHTVVSGADPKRTLLRWVDADWLDPEFARAVRHIRCRGAAARVTLVLERAPEAPAIAVAPSLDHLERAADDAKYGRSSREPWLETRAAGTTGDGRHRVEVHVQCAPYALADGEWSGQRALALGDLAVNALSRDFPEFKGAAVERVQAPRDLEAELGWPEGQPHQAELALDQVLWMRPVSALARYATPIGGLYLCGPAMHPGAGIAGGAGANAARGILRHVRDDGSDTRGVRPGGSTGIIQAGIT